MTKKPEAVWSAFGYEGFTIWDLRFTIGDLRLGIYDWGFGIWDLGSHLSRKFATCA